MSDHNVRVDESVISLGSESYGFVPITCAITSLRISIRLHCLLCKIIMLHICLPDLLIPQSLF